MTSDQTVHVHAHLAAVSKLLLGNKTMKPGLMILAGDPLSPPNRIKFGCTAVEAQVDLVYLEFTIGKDDLPVMTGINVMLPRDNVCYASTGCRLTLLPGMARAVLMARDGADYHFKVLAGEILQVRGRPASLMSGCNHAATKLATLVRDGVDVQNQVVLQTW